MSFKCGARATTNCAAGTSAVMSGMVSRSTGNVARSSFGRLPGSSATVGADGSRPARRRNASRGTHLDQIHQRVAHECHRNPLTLVERGLEREDRQHLRDESLHRVDVARAPGPQLRADVVDDRHAEPPNRARETEVEVGKVDRDEDVRPLGLRLRDEPPIHAV